RRIEGYWRSWTCRINAAIRGQRDTQCALDVKITPAFATGDGRGESVTPFGVGRVSGRRRHSKKSGEDIIAVLFIGGHPSVFHQEVVIGPSILVIRVFVGLPGRHTENDLDVL